MLLFRSEDQARQWCASQNRVQGELLTLDHVWQLAQAWYGNRMDANYRGRTMDQVIQIFEGVGLKSAFWKPK